MRLRYIVIGSFAWILFLSGASASAQDKGKADEPKDRQVKHARINVEVVGDAAQLEELMKRNSERLRNRHRKDQDRDQKAGEGKPGEPKPDHEKTQSPEKNASASDNQTPPGPQEQGIDPSQGKEKNGENGERNTREHRKHEDKGGKGHFEQDKQLRDKHNPLGDEDRFKKDRRRERKRFEHDASGDGSHPSVEGDHQEGDSRSPSGQNA